MKITIPKIKLTKGNTSKRAKKLSPSSKIIRLIKIFMILWAIITLVISFVAVGIWYNDKQRSQAEIDYWHALKGQVGKETTIRQINEYNYNK